MIVYKREDTVRKGKLVAVEEFPNVAAAAFWVSKEAGFKFGDVLDEIEEDGRVSDGEYLYMFMHLINGS